MFYGIDGSEDAIKLTQETIIRYPIIYTKVKYFPFHLLKHMIYT